MKAKVWFGNALVSLAAAAGLCALAMEPEATLALARMTRYLAMGTVAVMIDSLAFVAIRNIDSRTRPHGPTFEVRRSRLHRPSRAGDRTLS